MNVAYPLTPGYRCREFVRLELPETLAFWHAGPEVFVSSLGDLRLFGNVQSSHPARRPCPG